MKRPAFLLAMALLLIPIALITYRVVSLGHPLFATVPEERWQISIEARIVRTGDGDVSVVVGFPKAGRGYVVTEERITGGPLSVTVLQEGSNRYGVWTGSAGDGGVHIMYGATVLKHGKPILASPEIPLNVHLKDPWKAERFLAERLTAKWKNLPPPERLRAIVAAEAAGWKNSAASPEDLRQWAVFREKQGGVAALLATLRAAGLPAKAVEGLLLTDSVTDSPHALILAWTGNEWERVEPENGKMYDRSVEFLPLTWGGTHAVEVFNGTASETRWTVRKQIVSPWSLHFERIRHSNRFLDRWSLLRLPSEFQETFRILLLVPIGALMISILRNFVGFPTFGIFMPVLMALSFRNTGLGYGLGIFAGVLLIGYCVRYLIDRFHLLLVPRLSVILTLVIACYTVVALAGNELGLRGLMAIGLLPFVILTMSIERFFVILEEEGLRAGMQTSMGSAAVATITYGLINMEPLQLTFFLYPELLFAVAAAQVIVGRYTGYRLSELIRFRRLRDTS